MPRLIDRMAASPGAWFSFELFPPKTVEGQTALYSRMDRLARLEPLFVDVVWTNGRKSLASTLSVASHAEKYSGIPAMMHLTCQNMTASDVRAALTAAKAAGIKTIFALRGDPPDEGPLSSALPSAPSPTPSAPSSACDASPSSASASASASVSTSAPTTARDPPLTQAVDLVRLIREEHGDYFGIGVGAYPDKHPLAKSYEDDVAALKAKVDAGADFVVTQVVYDPSSYTRFVDDVRRAGVPDTVPIIPGIMPIYNPQTFRKVVSYAGTHLPTELDDRVSLEELNMAKSDPRDGRPSVSLEFKDWAVSYVASVCQQLLDSGAPGLHFFTLNICSSVTAIIADLGLGSATARRALPWRASHCAGREHEAVRPIYWANRPRSYISRTESWSVYPTGRWSEGSSKHKFEQIGDEPMTPADDRKALWGDTITSVQDVYEVFARYLQGVIPRLPWCEVELHIETSTISEQLARLNRSGFLTINSQPRVNGLTSSDPTFGWGGPGGYVYQKAYIEMFCSPELLAAVLSVIERFPSLQYLASDRSGNTYTNSSDSVQAVTWGVFPGREIAQPTVVDPACFKVWKDECFSLWIDHWASIYEPDSLSRDIIHSIHDSFFLLTVVDNDFIAGDIFAVFEAALDTIESSKTETSGGGSGGM